MHIGLGELTTPGLATITLASLVREVEAEYIEEALKPATARATTKVRMARFFILRNSPWAGMKVSKRFLWTNQMV